MKHTNFTDEIERLNRRDDNFTKYGCIVVAIAFVAVVLFNLIRYF